MEAVLLWLQGSFLGTPVWAWVLFLSIVLSLLVFDLGVLNRDHHEIEVRESLLLAGGYICIALLFGLGIWWQSGAERATLYLTAYVIEQSLSLDNLFVMAVIFRYFGIPRSHQHEVLFWGILGVIVFRAVMIGLGAALVQRFDWVLYLFGAFLLFTGIKMLLSREGDEPDLANNPLLKLLRRRLSVSEELHGHRFLVRLPDAAGRLQPHATPLLLALITIELADLAFAVDSVPAVLAITQDTFLVYTSNIFAVLGLRALYFALAALIHRFIYLKYALALVLVFIGGKVFLVGLVGHLPPWLSLSVTLSLLGGGILLSLLKTRNSD